MHFPCASGTPGDSRAVQILDVALFSGCVLVAHVPTRVRACSEACHTSTWAPCPMGVPPHGTYAPRWPDSGPSVSCVRPVVPAHLCFGLSPSMPLTSRSACWRCLGRARGREWLPLPPAWASVLHGGHRVLTAIPWCTRPRSRSAEMPTLWAGCAGAGARSSLTHSLSGARLKGPSSAVSGQPRHLSEHRRCGAVTQGPMGRCQEQGGGRGLTWGGHGTGWVTVVSAEQHHLPKPRCVRAVSTSTRHGISPFSRQGSGGSDTKGTCLQPRGPEAGAKDQDLGFSYGGGAPGTPGQQDGGRGPCIPAAEAVAAVGVRLMASAHRGHFCTTQAPPQTHLRRNGETEAE